AYTNSFPALSDFILALHESSDGSFWFGTDFDGGLFRLKNKKITRYWRGEYELRDPAVKVLHEDRKGRLWIGTRTALMQLHNYQMHRFTTADGLAGNVIQAICETQDGAVWFGTSDGLSCLQDKTFVNFKTGSG